MNQTTRIALFGTLLGLGALAALAGCSSGACDDGNQMDENGICVPVGDGPSATNITCADGSIVTSADQCATVGGVAPTGGQCATKQYNGFGGTKIDVGLLDESAGLNRGRIKPFAVLGTEFQRVLGAAPASLAASGQVFGVDDPRWTDEPQANAVSTYKMYMIAFEGCLTYTATAATYAALPTQATAEAECATMARKFWSRTATPEEVSACADNAITKAAKETNPRRRWAYACAAMITSAGFTTY